MINAVVAITALVTALAAAVGTLRLWLAEQRKADSNEHTSDFTIGAAIRNELRQEVERWQRQASALQKRVEELEEENDDQARQIAALTRILERRSEMQSMQDVANERRVRGSQE